MKRICCALAAWMLLSAPLLASPITIVGDTASSTSGLGDFSATLEYSFSDANNATLKVTLTNTTAGVGGYITAFVLNNPGDAISGITIPADAGVSLLGTAPFQDGVNGAPFGLFDFGVSTGGGFEGGGPPSEGLGVGDTGSVTFSLTGTGLDLLSELSFVNELSSGPSHDGHDHEFMLVRFRGMDSQVDDGDKVPGLQDTKDTPEPSSLVLAGLALGVLVPAWRRRRS